MGKDRYTKGIPLASLVKLLDKGKIRIPEFQRGEVWSKYQKQLLIDSILRGYDVPKLYFEKKEGAGHDYDVIDGQQRLAAVRDFYDDDFALDKDFDPVNGHVVAERTYSELHSDLSIDLDGYTFDIVHLVDYGEDDVKDMFVRLQHGTPLNAAEKRRALPGKMPGIVEAFDDHRFFDLVKYPNSRNAFQDTTAKLLHILIHGSITDIKVKSVQKTYLDNQTIDISDPAPKRLKRAMNFLSKAFKDGANPEFKKFSALSMVLVADEMLETYAINSKAKEFGEAYIQFEERRLKNAEMEDEDKDPILIEYASNARNDSIPALEFRHRILTREILRHMPELPLKDKNRDFTDGQRWLIYKRDEGTCQSCEAEVAQDQWHADHIVPHSEGGHTTVENGRVLCPKCNLAKGAKVA